MATYSNDATTSIVLSSTKNIRADGSTSLYTVGANEEYELIKSFVINQDGEAAVSICGIYDDDIIDHDVPDTGGEKGFSERLEITLNSGTNAFSTGGTPSTGDYHHFLFSLGTGNPPIAENDGALDHDGYVWNTDPVIHRPVKFLQGAEIKIFYQVSGFVSPEECQVFLWFKKTVHNG